MTMRTNLIEKFFKNGSLCICVGKRAYLATHIAETFLHSFGSFVYLSPSEVYCLPKLSYHLKVASFLRYVSRATKEGVKIEALRAYMWVKEPI